MTPNGVQMSPSAQSRQAFMVVRCPHLTKTLGFYLYFKKAPAELHKRGRL